MLETLENLLPYIPEDICTRCTRGCCQHDEPLPHSRNSQNKEYDHLKDGKRSINFNSGKMPLQFRSKRFHSKGPVRSKASNSAGLRLRSRNFHIEGLRKSETLQTSDGLHSHSSNDSTHPHFDGTRGINSVCQNALQTFILKISMSLIIARKYRHIVILSMVFLTRLSFPACEGVQVPINGMGAAVITSTNYPSTYPQYETREWSVNTPKGRMILLTFNNFSLGSLGDFTVIDNVFGRKRQRYGGEEKTFPPFLSRRNSLLLRFRSDGIPTRNGFNISASCFELSGTRVGRFVGGNTPAEGFLELQAESGGEWMRVCEESSADRLAEVVCGELGFPGVKNVSYEHGGCSPEGADPDCIRATICGDYAYRSQDCSASSEKCNSSLVVKVKCFEPGFEGCYNLSNTQLQNGSSYNSTSQCITSCRADTSQAIAIINGSECFCSTTIDIKQMEAQSCALHQLVYNATVGFCDELDDVMNGSWDSNITWFGSIVHLKCDDGYMLNGSGTLQCITKVPSYLPVWNGSIPTCEMITNTSHSMTSEQGNAAIAISSSMTALFTALLICIICAAV